MNGTRTSLRRSTYLRPYWRPLSLAGALGLAEIAFDLARPWPLKLVVDHTLGHRPFPAGLEAIGRLSPGWQAAVAAGLSVALVVVAGVTGYLRSYLGGAAAERVGADLRAQTLDRLLTLSLRFHDDNRSGELVSRLTGDVSRLQDALVAWLTVLVPQVLTVIGMLVVMVSVDWPLALTGLAATPLLAGVVVIRRRRVRAAQRDSRRCDGRLAAHATDVLRNVRAVQAFNREATVTSTFADHNRDATVAAIDALDLGIRFRPLTDTVLALGGGLVLWVGVLRVMSGAVTLGDLLVVLSYLGSFYGPIRSLSSLATTLARGEASRERLAEVLEADEVVVDLPGAPPAAPLHTDVRLCDVTFGYQPDRPVLRNLSCSIPAGGITCIVGPTGAGKTTLLNLLLRFYDPDSGRIEIDGVDLRDVSLSSLRQQIALVPQDPWILDGTVEDNIRFGEPAASPEEIAHAARTAMVTEFTDRLPAGLATAVGENGAQLSGGQRRRVAIARALVRSSSLLLLDEPTSGLDAVSEAEVVASLRAAAVGRTTVVVTHRLTIAALADLVLVVDGGCLVEAGPPTTLLSRNGPFARLWGVQHPLPAAVADGGATAHLTGKEVNLCRTAMDVIVDGASGA